MHCTRRVLPRPDDAARQAVQQERHLLTALKACSRSGDIEWGKLIHSWAVETGYLDSVYVASGLLDMYAKLGRIAEAHSVFSSMVRPDVVSWASLISGYAGCGQSQIAFELFCRMQREGCAPDATCYAAVLKGFKSLEGRDEVERCRLVHAQASHGGHVDLVVANTLIDVYAKWSEMREARRIFDRLQCPSVVSWTAMISGYAANGEAAASVEIFARMNFEGCLPDHVTLVAVLMCLDDLNKLRAIHCQASKYGHSSNQNLMVMTTLVDMYAKNHSLLDAQRVFDEMHNPSVVSWNALIFGYAEKGEGHIGLDLYARMVAEDSCVPNELTFIAALKACGMAVSLESGRAIHVQAFEYKEGAIVGALVDFYGKCGSMADAHRVFLRASSNENLDLVSLTALMGGYSRLGDVDNALKLFGMLEGRGVKPDHLTLHCLLTACSHSGRFETGKQHFDMIKDKYGIEPDIEHYACMVDMLARANKLEAAVGLARQMASKNGFAWTIILGASWKWRNLVVGRLAFESLKGLGEADGAAYASMANIYACYQK